MWSTHQGLADWNVCLGLGCVNLNLSCQLYLISVLNCVKLKCYFPELIFLLLTEVFLFFFFLQHLLHDCHFLFKYIYFLKKPLKILYHSLHRTLLLHVFPSVFIWLSVFLLSKLWCSERHGSQHQHWFRHVSISCLQKICDLFLFIFFILKSEVSCFKWTPPPGGTTCLLLGLSKSTITFMSSTGIL